MRNIIDLTGNTYGRLLVLNELPLKKNNQTYWKCKCTCGNTKYISARHLKDGNIKSCGCLRGAWYNRGNTGHIKTKYKRLIKIFNHMKQRCYNTNASNYKNYGGRGIEICNEWLNDSKKFYEWAESNGYNDTLSIDRINVNGNYEPNNCKWSTPKEQANNRRNNIFININGENKTIAEYANYYSCDYKKIYNKLYNKNNKK